ncbi:MAG: hypothetical protein BA872_09120 [Desulfobacterales bacterium C00003060]|nr:MAG: hypothetical protein BA861_09385 [Desulfobacterales bacterium S3730MH5]OEU78210.1 MAG: hypothetical protein BA865_06880 [Desulfobacterales bacterium S5133MH4]OEU78412.1 MAG: hypothetical protein BA872_09120 [Desulfobacterales bacterium C00003060]
MSKIRRFFWRKGGGLGLAYALRQSDISRFNHLSAQVIEKIQLFLCEPLAHFPAKWSEKEYISLLECAFDNVVLPVV